MQCSWPWPRTPTHGFFERRTGFATAVRPASPTPSRKPSFIGCSNGRGSDPSVSSRSRFPVESPDERGEGRHQGGGPAEIEVRHVLSSKSRTRQRSPAKAGLFRPARFLLKPRALWRRGRLWAGEIADGRAGRARAHSAPPNGLFFAKARTLAVDLPQVDDGKVPASSLSSNTNGLAPRTV